MSLKFSLAQNLPQVAIRPSSLKMHLVKRYLTRGNIDFLSPPSPLSCVVFCLFVNFFFLSIFCVAADVQSGAGPVQVNHWRWGAVDIFKNCFQNIWKTSLIILVGCWGRNFPQTLFDRPLEHVFVIKMWHLVSTSFFKNCFVAVRTGIPIYFYNCFRRTYLKTKGWQPHLDENGDPSMYHMQLTQFFETQRCNRLPKLERAFV